MLTMRERIIRSLTRSIVTGEPCALSTYNPSPPISVDERLQDAVIKDTLKAMQEDRNPAFSGDSRFVYKVRKGTSLRKKP